MEQEENSEFQARFQQAKYLNQEKKFAAAVDLWTVLFEMEPQHLGVLRGFSQALFQAQHFEQCLEILDIRLGFEREQLSTRLRIAKCFQRLHKNIDAENVWQQLAELHPKNVKVLNGQASFYSKVGQYEKSISISEKLMGLDKEHYQTLLRLSRTYILLKKPELAQVYISDLNLYYPNDENVILVNLRHFRYNLDYDGAINYLETKGVESPRISIEKAAIYSLKGNIAEAYRECSVASQKHPEFVTLRKHRLVYAASNPDLLRDYLWKLFTEDIDLVASDKALCVEFARLNIELGKSISDVAALLNDKLDAENRRLLESLSDDFLLGENASSRRELLVDNISEPVSFSKKRGGSRVLICFTGVAHKLGKFPVSYLDSLFAEYGIEVIILRDFSHNLYFQGVPTLGNNLDDTIASLKKLTEGKVIYTLGSSGGGLAALIYGEILNAKKVMCFSAPTNVQYDHMKRIGDFRGQALIKRINRVFHSDILDAKNTLTENTIKNIWLFYGELNEEDKNHAHYLQEFSNVKINSLPRVSEHNTLWEIATKGLAREVFQEFVNS